MTISAPAGTASSAIRTKIFVISLEGERRREQFAGSAYIENSGPSWAFFDAHRRPSSDLAYSVDKARVRAGRPLSQSELGCFSSHRATWAWLCDSDFDQLLIMEDDVVADWPFLSMLCAHDLHALGIDYLKLFAKIPPRTWKAVASPFLDPYYHLIQITSLALGCQGYLLTRKGARQLLDATRTIDAPVDVVLDRYWQTELPILAIYPSPLFERYRVSSIGDDRLDAHVLSRSERMRHLGWRLTERVRRELAARLPLKPELRAVRSAANALCAAPTSKGAQAGPAEAFAAAPEQKTAER